MWGASIIIHMVRQVFARARFVRIGAVALAAACAAGCSDPVAGLQPGTVPAPEFNTEGYNNAKLISRLYKGEFMTIHQIANRVPNGFDEMAVTVEIFIGAYHSAYARYCAAEVAREPSTQFGYFEYDVDEDGFRQSENRATGQTVVRNRFVSSYEAATGSMTGARLLGAFGLRASEWSVGASADMHQLVKNHGCTSPTTLQFEANLHHFYHEEPPVQAALPGILGISEFASVCAKPEIFEGKLKNEKACLCVHDLLKAEGPHVVRVVFEKGTQEMLVSQIMGRPGFAAKVRSCVN